MAGTTLTAAQLNQQVRDNENVIRANIADDATTKVLKVLTQLTLSVANNGTATIGNGADLEGFLFIEADEDNNGAIFHMNGGSGSTTEISDTSGTFSVTATTATSTNVYWSGTQYTIENKRGGTRTYRMTFIGSTAG